MPNKQLADDLRAARAVIEKPEAWSQHGYFAANCLGLWREVEDYDAVCFCALGATQKVARTKDSDDERLSGMATALLAANNGEYVAVFNDAASTSHADILALFDRAIAAAEA